MRLNNKLSKSLRYAVFAIGMFTAIIGGHMTGLYLLLEIKEPLLDYFAIAAASLTLMNLLTFLVCLGLQLTKLPEKHKIMGTGFGLLLNIPVAFGYVSILINYGV